VQLSLLSRFRVGLANNSQQEKVESLKAKDASRRGIAKPKSQNIIYGNIYVHLFLQRGGIENLVICLEVKRNEE
jgi:hypothetical protein